MNAKKCLVFCIKLLVSGVLALTILSMLCLVYYNPPIAVAQPDGYTNYKFAPNRPWSFMTEGNGRGIVSAFGYNDPQELIEGKKTICFLGSSQTEALEVGMEENFVSLLETKFAADYLESNDYQCINLGISGHFFNIVVSNFQNFANSFERVDYVVIEVNNIEFSDEVLEKMLNEEYHKDLGERSFIYKTLQRIPYMRLLFKQYSDLQKNSGVAAEVAVEVPNFENYAQRLNPVMSKLSDIAQEHNFEIIILYHKKIALDENNRAYTTGNAVAVEQFRQSCEANGIRFVSTDDVFCEHANSHMELPYGFANTRPGNGHLNVVGHRLIADLLYSEVFAEKEG